MSLESDLSTALSALCSDKCFPDVAPPGTAPPWITYQQVGGSVINAIDGSTMPGKARARIQVNVMHATRISANALMRQVEAALRASPFFAEVEGDLIAIYDEENEYRGAAQDFSIWYS